MEVKNKNTDAFTPRPHSFIDLMNMYEGNYIRLRLFCGDIRQLPDETISRVEGSVPVSLKVLERSRHTTLLMITYLFEDEDRRPDLKVQIYHDSRQADVVSRNCRITGRDIRLWEKQFDNVLLCRWRLNRFLYKWLGYLEHQGHSFKSNNNI
ncbi:hypothetical protein GCM10009133_18240 [Cocleimonas flava]|jgi:uncharacterized protein YqiB (DUF1249 family)|uniref:DUF1249 domain-containing protein n=1 Tax=Cocleimonas flava TaxID=634765 RepID=A0A4R1EZU2_9GAMM|nr:MULTISPECIES: DUF1249 domain-containing protein [Cocleimonas]MEB8433924.1 DUF1249 domain-containing protein [Cocleimonas sp. KMM 6892]MEC4716735.1 DUF1249 domain-containing protein [Cocleimonas sp. KMM 6895]MEC4746110.1 DUF1249 domain-containing protein [Cocleimonas sp. KMM 6896]TCJ84748.1 hypothetical protein EV695_2709 [Cocleimonas flava]